MIPLSTDWLSLSVRLLDDVQRAPAHHRWEVYEGGTNVWQQRRVLFNEYGEKVLTLLSHPKSIMLEPSLALVEIANEWLYHGLGVRSILTKLRWCVPFEILGLSRLDLAVDFNPNARMTKQIVGLGKGGLEVNNKQNGSGFWSINNQEWVPDAWRGKRCPHCISWGHKESDVKWKLYYKSKELRDAAGGGYFDKPYIVDLWRECDMDVNNVWRLEVSVKHCNKLLFDGKPLSLDAWGDDTLRLFEALYTSRFQLSNAGTRAKGRGCQHIPFLPVNKVEAVKCRSYDGDRVSSARISLLRQLVKSVDEEEVRLDSPTLQDVLSTINGIVERDHLQRYFQGMTGKVYETWREEMYAQLNDGRMPIIRNEGDVLRGIRPNVEFDGSFTATAQWG